MKTTRDMLPVRHQSSRTCSKSKIVFHTRGYEMNDENILKNQSITKIIRTSWTMHTAPFVGGKVPYVGGHKSTNIKYPRRCRCNTLLVVSVFKDHKPRKSLLSLE